MSLSLCGLALIGLGFVWHPNLHAIISVIQALSVFYTLLVIGIIRGTSLKGLSVLIRPHFVSISAFFMGHVTYRPLRRDYISVSATVLWFVFICVILIVAQSLTAEGGLSSLHAAVINCIVKKLTLSHCILGTEVDWPIAHSNSTFLFAELAESCQTG